MEKETKFCTACGVPLSPGVRFCEQCGEAVPRNEATVPDLPSGPEEPASVSAQPAPGSGRKIPIRTIAGIAVAIVILAVVAILILPAFSTFPGLRAAGPATPVPTMTAPVPQTTVPLPEPATTVPTPVPDPFPGALRLKDPLPFGSGELASVGTVYRVWMNDTYQWHNDMDNKYYPQVPAQGMKYLFVFVNVYNNGTSRVWPPTNNEVRVYYDGVWYSMDPVHFLPDRAKKAKDTPIEIKEIQYYSKLFGSEYVEDYGYSHGTQGAFLYPGKSNAFDGYIIYQVPASLTFDKAYARIAFNGNETGIWKLG